MRYENDGYDDVYDWILRIIIDEYFGIFLFMIKDTFLMILKMFWWYRVFMDVWKWKLEYKTYYYYGNKF